MDILDKQSHYCFGVCIQWSETAKKQINTSSGNKSYKKCKRVMGHSDRRWWGCIRLGCSGEVTGRVFKHKFKRIKEEVVQSNRRVSPQKPWEESGFGKTTEAGGEEAKVARPTLCRLLKPYLNLSKMQSTENLYFYRISVTEGLREDVVVRQATAQSRWEMMGPWTRVKHRGWDTKDVLMVWTWGL